MSEQTPNSEPPAGPDATGSEGVGGAVVHSITGGEDTTGSEPVGAADARADAVASGAENADESLPFGSDNRDSDGVPVGEDDADADVEASGADSR